MIHLLSTATVASAHSALATLLLAAEAPQKIAELRCHVVTLLLGAELAVAAGAIPEDGTDDAMLEAAHGIARLVDQGAG